MLNILKSTDKVEINTLTVLVYGQPGVGKTSISCTAKNPLLLDFDNGAYRSDFRCDSVPINNWKDVAKLKPEDIKGYDTIVIDTLGRSLDFLQAEIIHNDSKMSRKDGALTLQGYGALKSTFTNWLKQLSLLGKDVIMVAHDREDKDGDTKFVRPDIIGGSYNEIMKIADFVGYIFKVNRQSVIDFNPCEKFIGKNAAKFEALEIPNFTNATDYMESLVAKMKSSIGGIANNHIEALKIIEGYKVEIDNLNNPVDCDKFVEKMKVTDLKNGTLEQVKAMFKKRIEAIKCLPNKDTGKFYKIEEPKPEPKPEPKEEPKTEHQQVVDALPDEKPKDEISALFAGEKLPPVETKPYTFD